MANPRQLALLKRGVKLWNTWRATEYSPVDLRYADLSYANLSGANLSLADLSYANFQGADLSYATLRSSTVDYVNFQGANLNGVNIFAASFSGTVLPPNFIEEFGPRTAVLRAKQEKKPSSPPPSLDEIIKAFLSSPEGEIAAVIAMISSITGITAKDVIKWLWSKKLFPKKEPPSQPLETDFDRIRLRMAHGPDHIFPEWLDDPDKLKHYIEVWSQPSSSNQPLTVFFRQRNGTEIPVDARDYLQLDELLSYLKSQIER